MKLSQRLTVITMVVTIGLVSCGGPSSIPTAITASTPVESSTAAATPTGDRGCLLNTTAYSSNSPDGNHFVPGRANLSLAREVDIDLGAELQWVVGLGTEAGSRWFVSDSTGRIRDVVVEQGSPFALTLSEPWPESAPLAVRRAEAGMDLIGERLQPVSPLTNPIQLALNELAVITPEGGLMVVRDGIDQELPIAPLPDARLLIDGNGHLLVYSSPTADYDHGVLGDRLEAKAITAVNLSETQIAWVYEAPDDSVFEGLAPLWVDFNQDGSREVIATASDSRQGARYLVVGEDGQLLAQGEPIGRGYRWRHAIAVAPLAPDGSWELVGVRTPHLGGVVEYFQWIGGDLVLTASLEGYSSHRLGSRNLDQSLVADFDADGQYELLVPTQDYSSLAVIGRRQQGADEELRLELPARLSTNVAVACHQGELLALAAGLEDGTFRLWLP